MAHGSNRSGPLLLALGLLPGGCISTELNEPVREWANWPCAAAVSEQSANEAVLLVTTTRPVPLQPPTAPCSGVLIAPELVVTSRRCAVSAASAQPVDCDRANGWTPIAEAARDTYLGATLDIEDNIQIITGMTPVGRADAVVDEVIISEATSFCVDDFALLVLRSPLELEPVPLRLGAHTRLGEEVRLSGFGGGNAPMPRREMPAVVSRIESDRGSVRAPPRSLLLKGASCTYDRGGAVFSPETGALLGTLVQEPLSSCDVVEGTTRAVDLTRHADFILQAASARGIALRTELRSDLEGSQPPACAEVEP